ncbi:MAG: hypothetical protein K8R11_02425 [Methanococcoides sp.]|nr:hypothetical protein [Methanococcoides sp.]
MEIKLERTIKMERCEAIGKLRIEQERADLKQLLGLLQQEKGIDIPKRLKDLLCKLKLYESGNILEAGYNLLDKGTVLTEEYGHYEVWYLCNDEWLGSIPLSISRIIAKNGKEQRSGKKKGNWDTDVSFEKQFKFKDELTPIQFSRGEGVHNLSLMEVDALLPQQSHSSGKLVCKLDSEGFSSIELTSKVKWGHDNSTEDISLSSDWDPEEVYNLLPEIADQLGKTWDSSNGALLEAYPPDAEAELISYRRKETVLSNTSTKSAGSFENIKISDMPLRAETKRCAKSWLQNLMRKKWAESYTSIRSSLEDQKEWLNSIALNGHDLQLLEGEELLEFVDRNASNKTYWHIAALQDLIPSGVKTRSLPFTLRKSDTNPIGSISSRIGADQIVNEVCIIDRYANKKNQILTIQNICQELNVSSVSLVTLKKPEKLPDGWKYKNMGERLPENHDRHWFIKKDNDWEIWKCTTSPDFLSFKDNTVSVKTTATFTPIDYKDVPDTILEYVEGAEGMVI